jgi:transposase-like protein
MLKDFSSLQALEEAFPDEATAITRFRAVRWPNGIACVHCGSMKRVYDLKAGRHKCGDCQGKFTVRHKTVFEDSKLELRLWFKAIFLVSTRRKGISSHQLARDLDVTQKTAWFVLHRIREADSRKDAVHG